MDKKFTPEEIVKSLRVCAKPNHCEGCAARGHGFQYCDLLCDQAADLIEAQAKRIAELEEELRWIPVGERLPEKGDASGDGEVLAVWVEGKVMDPSPKACSGSCAQPWKYVAQHPAWFSHWKPMPTGPEVGHE